MAEPAVPEEVDDEQPGQPRPAREHASTAGQEGYGPFGDRDPRADLKTPESHPEQATVHADPKRARACDHPSPLSGPDAEVDRTVESVKEGVAARDPQRPLAVGCNIFDARSGQRPGRRPI